MPTLRLTHQGHAVSIDPVSGLLSAVVDHTSHTWPKWAAARKALDSKTPQDETLARTDACLVSEGDCRPVALWGPQAGAWTHVERLDDGETFPFSEIAFPGVALAGLKSSDEQISQRRQILGARTERLAQQQRFLDEGLDEEALTRWIESARIDTAEPILTGWQETRKGELSHVDGWRLSAVLHGRHGSFLGYHLSHGASGWMRMSPTPADALRLVDALSLRRMTGRGQEGVIWAGTDTPLQALMTGRSQTLMARATLGTHEVLLLRDRGRYKVLDRTRLEGARVLTGDRMQRWQTFAEDAWTAWKAEDAAMNALDKPTSARA